MALLKELESAAVGDRAALSDVLDALPYNAQGLVAAIAQEQDSGEVLMLGWMDRTAIERTLDEGYVCYYSRSRQAYWRKGETSGNLQTFFRMALDCDGDAILVTVKQQGPACHTNRRNCFYLAVDGQEVVIDAAPSMPGS